MPVCCSMNCGLGASCDIECTICQSAKSIRNPNILSGLPALWCLCKSTCRDGNAHITRGQQTLSSKVLPSKHADHGNSCNSVDHRAQDQPTPDPWDARHDARAYDIRRIALQQVWSNNPHSHCHADRGISRTRILREDCRRRFPHPLTDRDI